eukprot:144441-Chlamydomonas_euryale.AAC.1
MYSCGGRASALAGTWGLSGWAGRQEGRRAGRGAVGGRAGQALGRAGELGQAGGLAGQWAGGWRLSEWTGSPVDEQACAHTHDLAGAQPAHEWTAGGQARGIVLPGGGGREEYLSLRRVKLMEADNSAAEAS